MRTERIAQAHGIAKRRGATFPYGTLLINVSGSAVLGLFLAVTTERLLIDPRWRQFLAIGFMGAYTTFSTYTYESMQLLLAGKPMRAIQANDRWPVMVMSGECRALARFKNEHCAEAGALATGDGNFGLLRAFPPRFLDERQPLLGHWRRGIPIGTAGYSPPEQYRGRVGPRSDIFALGATMHHLLTGRDQRQGPPFMFDQYRLRALNPAVLKDLDRIVMRCLKRRMAQRYASARALRQDLEGLAL